MPGSGIIDLAIGLAFVFGVTAALSSVITELIARYLGLRGAYLLRGLRELLDGAGTTTVLSEAQDDYQTMKDLMGHRPPPPVATARRAPAARAAAAGQPPAPAPQPGPGPQPGAAPQPGAVPQSATGALLGSPILRSQGMTGQISTRNLIMRPAAPAGRPAAPAGQPEPAARAARLETSEGKRPWGACRSLPAYISARSFSEAIMDLVVPDAAGLTTMNSVSHYVSELPDSMPTLKTSLQALVTNAGDDVASFRTSVENWYDDHMDRVSGWYKRHVAKITIVVGAILVLLLNINTLTIGRTLYNDSVVRTAVSSVAAKAPCPAGQSQQTCLVNLQAQLSAAAQVGLPIGWATVPGCAAPKTSCNWLDQRGIFSRHGGSGWQVVLVLIGFLITITALTPGARFWFDLLGRLGSLRSTGPKPAPPAS
jgi:hypothetical protein